MCFLLEGPAEIFIDARSGLDTSRKSLRKAEAVPGTVRTMQMTAHATSERVPTSGDGGYIGTLLGGPLVVRSLIATSGSRPFSLSPLPYDYDGLEPVIDRATLRWQHDVLHRSYVEGLNGSLRNHDIRGLPLESLLAQISRFPESVREAAGAHWNHTFYWSVMTDLKENHEISPELQHAIEGSFTSFENFKAQFVRVGEEHQGPGWIWLLKTPQGKLKVFTVKNHDNPLMDIMDEPGTPLLACDLREHASQQKAKISRSEFLKRFFTLINWARVDNLYKGVHH